MKGLEYIVLLFILLPFSVRLEAAIDIIFDYRYDTTNWFGDEQRYIMDQAAYAFESRLGGETFGSLIPADYGSVNGKLTASNPDWRDQFLPRMPLLWGLLQFQESPIGVQSVGFSL